MKKLSPLLALALLPIAAFGEPRVEIERVGEVIKIDAAIPVAANSVVAWEVLTDYNRLADFVPGMQSSRVVSAPGASIKVEQRGETGFFIWQFPVEVVLEIEEDPTRRIRFKSVSGNLNMRGAWQVFARANETCLEYSASMETGFCVPPVIGAAIIRRDVKRKLEGVEQEMVRRSRESKEQR